VYLGYLGSRGYLGLEPVGGVPEDAVEARVRTVDYDRFMKSQLASRNSL
jgi:hypothetical protein